MKASDPPELILRHVYLDEAGISNPIHEPYTVVSGVMVHVDDQYEPARRYLAAMADDLVGTDRPADFFFHAKDIWHGTNFFSGERWKDVQKRRAVLRHLAEMIVKFEMPVIYSCLERSAYLPEVDPNWPTRKRRQAGAKAAQYCHTICFVSCLHLIELFMRDRHSDEKVFLVAEQHRDHQKGLQAFANFFTDTQFKEKTRHLPNFSWEPSTHLVEEPMFVKKSLNSLCQLADASAFILSRALADKEDIQPLLRIIEPNLATGFVRKFVNDASVAQSS